MNGAFLHILPVLLVIAAGWTARRTGLMNDAGRAGIERTTYYLLFPSLIFLSLARTDFSAFPALPLGATLFSALLAMAAIVLLLRKPLSGWLAMDGASYTSLFQGATRWNTFIGLAVAGSLFGTDGLALVSVAIVAIVPMVNLICVLVLARYAASEAPTAGLVLAALLRNPFIWACALGLAANASGIPMAGPLATALDLLGSAAVATGLIAVGASLRLGALAQPAPPLLAASALKLLLMPAIGIAFALVYGVSGEALAVAIIALSVPTATNAYVLAREMGGDAPLMAEIITFQTALAMVTMPLWLLIVGR